MFLRSSSLVLRRSLIRSEKGHGFMIKAAAKRLITATTAVGVGVIGYYLFQDEVYLEEAKGASARVPFSALHPELGGAKNLPIVSHQLDDEVEGTAGKPRLVILGSGWGAVSVLKNLDKDRYNVTVISDHNYFLFTPLLPCVTVGTHDPRSILEPIRKIAARVHGHFLQAKATDIDLENKLVEVKGVSDGKSFYVPYDKLVIAVGATSITHGVEGIEYTHQLKTIQDAMDIRRKVMRNVEQACLPTTSPEERKRLLSFVICGGGPTGTEAAAEWFDWMNEDLVKWFPKLLREDISVTLIQSRDHILNTFDVRISEYAEKRFEREKIKVITNARVSRIDRDKVVFRRKDTGQTEEIPYGLCLWSTGIAMTPFVQSIADKLGIQGHQRALITDGFLRVKGVSDGSVLAIGDCATVENPKLQEHIMEIFEEADKNKDGTLSLEEFREAVAYMQRRFPLTEQYLKELVDTFRKYDADKSDSLDITEMRAMLRDVESKMTHLPATAQVASQQGRYVAQCLNQISKDESTELGPFVYRHLGTLAYLGNSAVGEFTWGYKMMGGLWAMYLWRGVYWSEQVSMRTRLNLSIDWTKRALFGRDFSNV